RVISPARQPVTSKRAPAKQATGTPETSRSAVSRSEESNVDLTDNGTQRRRVGDDDDYNLYNDNYENDRDHDEEDDMVVEDDREEESSKDDEEEGSDEEDPYVQLTPSPPRRTAVRGNA